MLTQVDVRDFWDLIAPGVWEIKNESEPDWRPEDIYTALINNVAELYVSKEENPCKRFIILQEKLSIFNNTKSLLIWLAYDKRGNAADKYMNYIENMAKQRGCNKVEFWTPWENLAKALSSKGYKTKLYLTEKEI